MNFFIGVTDYEWFQLHAAKQNVEEVNFWRPSPDMPFKSLQAGEAMLFKLHAPRNFIAGGGFFTKFLQLPISLAWDAFGEANGVRSLGEKRNRIGKYRRAEIVTRRERALARGKATYNGVGRYGGTKSDSGDTR